MQVKNELENVSVSDKSKYQAAPLMYLKPVETAISNSLGGEEKKSETMQSNHNAEIEDLKSER